MDEHGQGDRSILLSAGRPNLVRININYQNMNINKSVTVRFKQIFVIYQTMVVNILLLKRHLLIDLDTNHSFESTYFDV